MASSFVYDIAKAGFANGLLCLWSSTTASYYLCLVSNNYVPNPGHSAASNFSGAELSSTSHTAGYNGTGRISLTTRTVFSNTTSHQAEFRCADVTWTGISAGTAHAFIIIQQSGTDALSPLVAYCSLGGFPVTTNGGNLLLSFANSGVFRLTDA